MDNWLGVCVIRLVGRYEYLGEWAVDENIGD